MTHDEITRALRAPDRARDVYPVRAIHPATDEAVRRRIDLALRALDAGKPEDARQWLERAANHLRLFA